MLAPSWAPPSDAFRDSLGIDHSSFDCNDDLPLHFASFACSLSFGCLTFADDMNTTIVAVRRFERLFAVVSEIRHVVAENVEHDLDWLISVDRLDDCIF